MVGRGEVRRDVGVAPPGAGHPRPQHPGADPPAHELLVADRVVDGDRVRLGRRPRRTRGSRGRGSPGRTRRSGRWPRRPTSGSVTCRRCAARTCSVTVLQVGLAVGGEPLPDVLGGPPAGDVGQVPAGHRPQRHPEVVVDVEPLDLAREVQRHRVAGAGWRRYAGRPPPRTPPARTTPLELVTAIQHGQMSDVLHEGRLVSEVVSEHPSGAVWKASDRAQRDQPHPTRGAIVTSDGPAISFDRPCSTWTAPWWTRSTSTSWRGDRRSSASGWTSRPGTDPPGDRDRRRPPGHRGGRPVRGGGVGDEVRAIHDERFETSCRR